jgi:hypothetical protein
MTDGAQSDVPAWIGRLRLEPGETLLWSGRTAQGFAFGCLPYAAAAVTVPMALLLRGTVFDGIMAACLGVTAVVIALGEAGGSEFGRPAFGALVTLSVILSTFLAEEMLLAFAALAILWASCAAVRSFVVDPAERYALTDRRALVAYELPLGPVRSVPLDAETSIRLVSDAEPDQEEEEDEDDLEDLEVRWAEQGFDRARIERLRAAAADDDWETVWAEEGLDQAEIQSRLAAIADDEAFEREFGSRPSVRFARDGRKLTFRDIADAEAIVSLAEAARSGTAGS